MPLLRPLLPQWGSLVAYSPSNVLIIAGNASNVNRIVKIIHRVDITNTDGISIMPLRYAIASDLVKTINSLEKGQANAGTPLANIAAESESNTILISGTKTARLKMRVLISELDTPNASGQSGHTQVIRLHYLKAKDLVPILAGVAKSFGNPVGTVVGSISDQIAYSNGADNGGSSGANYYDNANSGEAASLPKTGSETIKTSQSSGKSGRPKVEIIGDPNTNTVIINAPPTVMRSMKAVVRELDKRPTQVLVEAMIAEVDASDLAQLGINFGTVATGNQVGEDTSQSSSNDGTSAMFQNGIAIISKDGLQDLQGVITALQNTQNADILSTPSVVVLNNHEAKIEVGQQISVLDSNFPNNAGGTTNATPYNTFKQEKVALHLYVTPSISQSHTVQLTISQGNDTLQNPQDPTTTPVINISNIDTSVLVNSGDTLVLGGLIQNQDASGVANGLPFLSHIPILGYLFGRHSHGTQKKMLMVFIRPVILHTPHENYQATGEKYQFIRNQQSVMGQKSTHQ